MESSFINLKLISCKDIHAFNFFQKLTLYAQASISSNNPRIQLNEKNTQQQRTPTHRNPEEDGTNPEWNHDMRFDLSFLSSHSDPTEFFICFEFRHDGVILGDKFIGQSRVPITDLINDVDGITRFVSYEIRSAEGKPNGIFDFSYKLEGVQNQSSQILDGRISGYPVLTPEDCAPAPVQYPISEIERPCCYSVPEGPFYAPVAATAPPPVSYPFAGDCNYYYPPPQPSMYPYPPPPPPRERLYPPIGPEAHYWQSGPHFENRW
ncbi:protein SRC2 homolog [Vicia villosa]|uniref:protein SRC2 homolog n=1 Tax=Vicia villosa TaxID=3911 RepID=UPI00273A825D|nr:protein SRC2 homolog [Vicia villosa]